MANNALDNAAGTVFVDYVRKARPNMREASILQGEHWRIGILTESLIRFEWSDSGEFEDNLTQMVVNRDFGADPQFTVTHRDGLLIVDTPRIVCDVRWQAVQQRRLERGCQGRGRHPVQYVALRRRAEA